MLTGEPFVASSLHACWSAFRGILENGMLWLTYRLWTSSACGTAVGAEQTFSSERQYFHVWVNFFFNSDDSEHFPVCFVRSIAFSSAAFLLVGWSVGWFFGYFYSLLRLYSMLTAYVRGVRSRILFLILFINYLAIPVAIHSLYDLHNMLVRFVFMYCANQSVR
jgi:hypothetical protein